MRGIRRGLGLWGTGVVLTLTVVASPGAALAAEDLVPVPETGAPGLLSLSSSVYPLTLPVLEPDESFSWQIGLTMTEPVATATLQVTAAGEIAGTDRYLVSGGGVRCAVAGDQRTQRKPELPVRRHLQDSIHDTGCASTGCPGSAQRPWHRDDVLSAIYACPARRLCRIWRHFTDAGDWREHHGGVRRGRVVSRSRPIAGGQASRRSQPNPGDPSNRRRPAESGNGGPPMDASRPDTGGADTGHG